MWKKIRGSAEAKGKLFVSSTTQLLFCVETDSLSVFRPTHEIDRLRSNLLKKIQKVSFEKLDISKNEGNIIFMNEGLR